MYRYEMSPIDFFDGCLTLTEYLTAIAHKPRSCWNKEPGETIVDTISLLVAEMGKLKYWEGDIKDGIYVFAIPGDVETRIGFVWKQDNNGQTFVISPVELPHLKEYSF